MSSRESSSALLEQIADALLAAESSRGLLRSLDDLLELIGARPAVLYMADAAAGVLYPAAGFGRESDGAELPLPAAGADPVPGGLPLRSRGELVGLLAVPEAATQHVAVRRLGAILGPVLMHLHRQEQAQRDLRHSREIIANLLAAGELLHHLDLEVLLVKILETMLGAVQAQVGSVLVLEEGRPVPRVTWGLRQEHLERIRTSADVPLAEHVVKHGRAVCLNADDLANGALRLDGLDAHLTGILALPLTSRDAVHGVVVLANPEAEFGNNQRRLAEMVCTLAAIALDNALLVKAMVEGERLRQEMDLARKVQEGMYPTRGLERGGLVVEGCSRPCSETGGDYFTFAERDGRLLAMIGDVSGHGLGAALYTTMAHVLVQQQLRAGAGLDPAFRSLNEGLYHTQSGRFMTAALVEVDPAAGRLRYVSAGHNPLLLIQGGALRWLDSSGLPLGIIESGEWPEVADLVLAPGDCLVLYTDGFVEAVDHAGEVFGDERFAAAILDGHRRGLPPQELAAAVNAAVDAWTGGKAHDDDLTLVILQHRPG